MVKIGQTVVSGDWLLFSSGNVEDKVWLGRAVENPDWPDGQAIYINETGLKLEKWGTGKITLEPGEAALNVQWFERANLSTTVRAKDKSVSFVMSKLDPCCQSTKYLVAAKIQEHVCQLAGKPAKRAYYRRARVGQSTTRETFGGKKARDYGTTAATVAKENAKQTWELSCPTYWGACELADKLIVLV